MGDTAAIVVSLVFLACVLLFTMYLLGALTGALAGVSTGALGRIGLGALGLLLANPVMMFITGRPAVLASWILPPVAAASAIVMIRRLKRRDVERRARSASPSELL